MLAGLRRLASYDGERLARTDPEQVAGEVATVFAQFERLVTSTRQFYASLAAVLNRYDLSREDFQASRRRCSTTCSASSRRSPGGAADRRRAGGARPGAAARSSRLAERQAAQRERDAALQELAACRGVRDSLDLSDAARSVLLELYARALAGAGGPLVGPARAQAEEVGLVVTRTPGRSTTVRSPAGFLDLVDLSLELV